jgi:glycosyltransferase involved in cell wall biosynthesis
MASNPERIHVAVFIDYAGETGGAETLAVQLLERLDPERFARTLVVYRRIERDDPLAGEHAAVADRLRRGGVEILALDRGGRFDLAAWRPFLRRLRSGEIDVLHSHKFGPNVWATLLARCAEVPVVVAHEHTWSFVGEPLRKLLDRGLIASGSDLVVAVSEQDRERMTRIERIPAGRIRVLPNGIGRPLVEPGAAAEVRAELGVPAGAPLIGTVGVVRPQKDLPTLVAAHARLLATVPGAHLAIVGGGPLLGELEQLVAREGLDGRVRLLGERGDAVRLASAFDVAVNSSRFEGSSLAVIEYMALARPIVATAVGGTPDLLGGGAAGVLVPPADPVALADAIGALLADPGRARELGERARERQRELYDLDLQVRRLEELYERLLAETRARRPRRWWQRGRRPLPRLAA